MSEMQLGLALLGVGLLLLVVIYNVWQTRQSRPRQGVGVDAAQRAASAQEPSLEDGCFSDDRLLVPSHDRRAALDALIDVIAPISLDSALSGAAVLAALPATRRVGSKAFAIEGFNASAQRWEQTQAGQRYSQLQAGVQMANRSGALNDIEFSEFVVKTQVFCDAVNATPEFPDMRQAVSRARELDQFAAAHDAQLTFVLRAKRAAWSPSYVTRIAQRYNFIAGSTAGRMILPARQSNLFAILSLSFDTQAALADDPTLSALREITLALDVAQVERGENAFVRMREAAANLAAAMDGVITDDAGAPLSEAALDAIAEQLAALYETLDQHEFSAGSALARRLFS